MKRSRAERRDSHICESDTLKNVAMGVGFLLVLTVAIVLIRMGMGPGAD